MAPKILQIKSEDSENLYHHLKIIENKGGGDCLFLALRYFLQNTTCKFDKVPKNATELRLQSVEYMLRRNARGFRLNFDRFRDTLIFNLEGHIPDIVKYGKNSTDDETIRQAYKEHMSKPGNCGTFAELCAVAEIFGFVGHLFRRDELENYICYEFGFTGNKSKDATKRKAILLFTGSTGYGHFRLLDPTKPETFPTVLPGKYIEIRNDSATKSKQIISIAREASINHNQLSQHTQSSPSQKTELLQCNLCSSNSTKRYKGAKGLKIHCRLFHSEEDQQQPEEPSTNFEDFVNLLSRCKNNIRILKRIPRGARVQAANALAICIDKCVSEPEVGKNWENLLTFAYRCLKVPTKQVKNISLTTLVKRCIDKQELKIPKPTTKNRSISLFQRIESKIADGDVRGAVKILSSNDTLAKQDSNTLERLIEKHPPPADALLTFKQPDENITPLQVSERDVYVAIRNFPNGSSSGSDGILPEHLKELTSPVTGEAGIRLLRAITKLSNMMLNKTVNETYSKLIYGASLCALNKEEGGIRPIAVGIVFRRITAKLACGSVRAEMGSKFKPRQVGFGTRNGSEAAAHATRTFIKKHRGSRKVILKIDYRNAFNEVSREKFLDEIRLNTPAIYPFILQCYSSPTYLFFGEDMILSQNGAQQGDPCGPLLFCCAIDSVVQDIESEFTVFFLDDGTIGGDVSSVLKDFSMIVEESLKIGLIVNPTKCELYFCSDVDQKVVDEFEKLAPGIRIVKELTLLGAPVTENATLKVVNKKIKEMDLLFERLIDLENHHIAFYLLKNCFALPKLIYTLRTTPLRNHQDIINTIDSNIKSTLETITNCHLDTQQWILSSLPIRCGGLGIRRIQDVAIPAFLSTVHCVFDLVTCMLNSPDVTINDLTDYNEAYTEWCAMIPEAEVPANVCSQKCWDIVNTNRLVKSLNFESEIDKARFLAIQKPESSAWLHALPSKEIGTLLNNNVLRIMVGLRLGCNICKPHRCVCGSMVDSKGLHGLLCRKSAGRFPKHAELNHIIKRGLSSAEISSKLEPPGLCRSDGKRVDGMSIIPWSKRKFLIWDATCTDTFASTNLKICSKEAGKGAERAAVSKRSLYVELIRQNYHFIPFAVETMGPWCKEGIDFINQLGKLIELRNNEPRSTFFLKQRISLAIQRGNASSIMGTMADSETSDV